MIHDLLLACLHLKSGSSSLKMIVETGDYDNIFHPSEKQILLDIIEQIECFGEVAKFANTYGVYGSRKRFFGNTKPDNDDEPILKEGIYLIALSSGIEVLINNYHDEIVELEKRYLKLPTYSIMLIYQKVHEFKYICYIANTMLRMIKVHRYHGSALLNYLYSCSNHGDPDVAKAVGICMKPVVNAFLRQLTNWLLYARNGDPHNEFFIRAITDDRRSLSDSDLDNIGNTLHNERGSNDTLNKISDCIDYDSIWQYEIIYEAVPSFLSVEYADKIFFIGQTVLIFNVYASICDDEFRTTTTDDEDLIDNINNGTELYLWNDKEQVFFKKLQSLYNKEINSREYENVIDEIKNHVTQRLLDIAVDKADLLKQLNLIKDFFLLGRGELFYEFIHLLHDCEKEQEDNDSKLTSFIKSFEEAASSLGIIDELDHVALRVVNVDDDLDFTTEFDFLQQISLEYRIKWPLHLLFSPKIMERYNILFRFLLLIRKLQFDLHSVWVLQNVCAKNKMTINNKDVRLRNNLMFFVDNLQYYIQSDVLDSEFGILKAIIEEKNDFERIQKGHAVFLANVLSHCFLLSDSEDQENITFAKAPSMINNTHPVYLVIIELCHVVEEFYHTVCGGIDNEYQSKIESLDSRFDFLITELTEVFVQYKATAYASPLSQLLLRLDYNHWFSSGKHRSSNDSSSE